MTTFEYFKTLAKELGFWVLFGLETLWTMYLENLAAVTVGMGVGFLLGRM